MRPKNAIAAAVPTVLFAGTLGVLIAVTVFGIARISDQMLEAIDLIPLHWGENHVDILFDIAIAFSAPVVVWFSWWFFRKARDVEGRLTDYTYTPPAEK